MAQQASSPLVQVMYTPILVTIYGVLRRARTSTIFLNQATER